MSVRRKQYGPECGFTLLELLVALALMGMLAVMLTNGLGFSTGAWERTENVTRTNGQIHALQDLMRDWIGGAYPYDISRAQARIAYPMEGIDNRVTFSAPLAIDPLDDRLYRMALIHNPLEQTVNLHWITDKNWERDPVYGNGVRATVLLENVRRFRIDYLEPEEGLQARWVERWQDQEKLPLAVRIEIAFEEGDERSWPPLVIRSRITRSAHCEFDPVSRGCREGIS